MLDERLRAEREDPGLEDVSGRLGPGGLDPLVITPPEDEFRLLSAERPVLARGDPRAVGVLPAFAEGRSP